MTWYNNITKKIKPNQLCIDKVSLKVSRNPSFTDLPLSASSIVPRKNMYLNFNSFLRMKLIFLKTKYHSHMKLKSQLHITANKSQQ